jgi:hypothetical protein
MNIRPVGAKLFYADGRTDMTKLIFAFRNSANAPKNGYALNIIEDTQFKIMAQWFMKSVVEVFTTNSRVLSHCGS